MHRVTWRVRCAALCFARLRRRLMERWGLTPARFDMLFAIKCQRQAWFPQRTLRELLGVCASTISRMIDSLVELGFLVRRRVEGDKRRRELGITSHGKRTLRCMFGNIIRSGLARRIVGHALADDPDGDPTNHAKITRYIRAFEVTMAYLLLNLENPAWFDYGDNGERAMPNPRTIDVPSEDDRALWLGDVEPLLSWVARL
jgi:DNA-binding MarR family transcriptional regulator